MTKLAAAFHAIFYLAAASLLAGCGRTPVGETTANGGAPPVGCSSNSDCAATPSTPFCEIPPGQCVACLTDPDTCPSGEACDPTTHTCVPVQTGCKSDADCMFPTPHCRLDTHTCVECTSDTQCGPSQVCSNFHCVGVCGGGASCGPGLSCCDPICVDESSDPNNCGGCNMFCGPWPNAVSQCLGATCSIAKCAPNFADCDGLTSDGCEINTAVDPNNCGTCGKACAPGETCSGGTCLGSCGGTTDCQTGQTCCGTFCANTQSDPNNCGGCGKVCPTVPNGSTACQASACKLTSCTTHFADCNGQIGDGCEVDTNTDPKNCGTCGNVCASGMCVAGTCQQTNCQQTGCPNNFACCGTTCIDIDNDLNNCGGCGAPCPPGTTECKGGACCTIQPGGGEVCSAMVCPGNQVNCGGTCVDETSDPKNCGACFKQCPAGSSCVNSMCTATCNGGPACGANQKCCMSGCADTLNDPQNCGGCGNACAPGAGCVNGQCQATCNGGPMCSPAQTCCTSGCTDTTTDPNNCGLCGKACPTGSICVASQCQATCNGGPMCTGAQKCCATGCSDTTSDPKNCGGCGIACAAGATCVNSMCQMPQQCNGGPACTGSQTCCPNVGCVDTSSDSNHCGNCNTVCGATASCVSGMCAVNEGAFNPMVNPTYLPPGVHNFTTINIPAGVVVYVAGPGAQSGTLDLHATGAIVIDGTIDLSGGPGTQNVITSMSTQAGRAGAGGFTGEPYQSAAPSAACAFVAGNPGQLGFALAGTAGNCHVASTTTCITQMDPNALIWASPPAQYGGGAGVFTGYRAYGSGGGGPAGGAPGQLGAAVNGEQDCSGASGGGGAVNGQGGVAGSAVYNGKSGTLGQTQCQGVMGFPPAYVGGGGGGSIGAKAAADLAVATTFQTGSGGGGGSADYLNRPVFGGTSGGGGGGGALRLSSPVSITVHGQLLANGGPGGDAFIGNGSNAGCDPQPGAAGGGGSGGVIYLSSPSITVSSSATISAQGGAGGAGSLFASGGAGGAGGLGRIRLSVSQATCSLAGSAFKPALVSGCNPTTGTAGFTYIGTYPN